jgi:hypothetical protein
MQKQETRYVDEIDDGLIKVDTINFDPKVKDWGPAKIKA